MSHISEETKTEMQEQLRESIRVHIKDQLAVNAHQSAVERGYLKEEEEEEQVEEEESETDGDEDGEDSDDDEGESDEKDQD